MDVSSLHLCAHRIVSLRLQEIEAVEARVRRDHPEATIIQSCQRLEAYGLTPCTCNNGEQKRGVDALLHLASVTAGLDSVVLGEAQIVGQVRSALASAPPHVQRLADIAIAAARDLRRATHFDSHAGHLLDRSLKVADVPAAGRLLVLGGGAMGRLVAARGVELGFDEVIVASRTRPTAASASWHFVPLREVADIPAVDVVAGCLGSGAGEIPYAQLPGIRRLVADLGTPRNFADDADVPVVTIASLLADERARPHAARRRTELRETLRVMLERRLAAPQMTAARRWARSAPASRTSGNASSCACAVFTRKSPPTPWTSSAARL